MLKVGFGQVKTDPCYSFRIYTRADLARTKRNVPLEMRNLKQIEHQRLKKERLRIRRENKKTENHEKQILDTLKRLQRGDDNELERNLRLKKVVASKTAQVGE